jgi:TRAP-type C4-dicarboxylate transport system permease small subunit
VDASATGGAPPAAGGPAGWAGRLDHAVGRIADAAAWLAVAGVMLILVLVCAEIVLRNGFNRSTMVADEYGGYLNMAVTFFGMTYTLRSGAFVRVELLFNRLKGVTRRVAEGFIVLASLAFTAVLARVAWKEFAYSLHNDVHSVDVMQTPLWIPQGLMFAGCMLLLLQLVAWTLRGGRNLP